MNNISPLKKRNKRHSNDIWNNFETIEDGVQCKICLQTFSASTSTFSLRYHFQTIHTASIPKDPFTFNNNSAEELLVCFLSKHALPLWIIDSAEFQDFMHYLNPKFQTPNRKYLSKVMLPNLRSIIELQIQKDISVIPYYSIAVDSWTIIANKAYLSITFHGVTSNWILKSYVLDVIAIKKAEPLNV